VWTDRDNWIFKIFNNAIHFSQWDFNFVIVMRYKTVNSDGSQTYQPPIIFTIIDRASTLFNSRKKRRKKKEKHLKPKNTLIKCWIYTE